MSYSSLYVPLDIGTWNCELLPARDYRSPSGGQLPFVKSDELRQIEDDRSTFERYFRPNYDFRRPITADIDAICSFLRDCLNLAHWNVPTDNDGIACAKVCRERAMQRYANCLRGKGPSL